MPNYDLEDVSLYREFLVGLLHDHFGASLKDLGNKGFMFSRIEEPAVIKALRKQIDTEWSRATVVV